MIMIMSRVYRNSGRRGRKGTETFAKTGIWKNKSNDKMEGIPRLWDLLRDRKELGRDNGKELTSIEKNRFACNPQRSPRDVFYGEAEARG